MVQINVDQYESHLLACLTFAVASLRDGIARVDEEVFALTAIIYILF